MTLSRQLTIIIIALFAFVFVGTFTISVNNTRNYLITQLESHAQDTATSLGLSLSPHMQENDLVTMNSMIDAIFDRGYYKEIVVQSTEGEKLIERVNPMTIQGIPNWFISLVPLNTPRGEALIMSGWAQAGTVWVTSHPGYAYDELWHTAVGTARWFSLCALASLAVTLLLLRIVLKPLKAVEEQADAICNRKYPLQAVIPRTRELRRVVLAMNRVSEKVRQMFQEQTAITENLRKEVFVDPVTSFGNRRYFDTHLQHLLQDREEGATGALLLLQLGGFKEFNDEFGYQAGDELLRRTAALIQQSCDESTETLLARLTGADFAVVLTKTSADQVTELCKSLCDNLLQLQADGLVARVATADLGHVGATLFGPNQPVSALLANADYALRAAQSKGPNSWHVHQADTSLALPQGARDWQSYLDKMIDKQHARLYFQPIAPLNDKDIAHHEVLLRLIDDDGRPISAGVFLPMAERLGMAREIDKLVIEASFDHASRDANWSRRYAVNISAASVADPEFVAWLLALLKGAPEKASRLIFEMPEYGVVKQVDAVKAFVQKLTPLGAQFSIDHFGRGFSSFAYLRSLAVDYIKIDGSYIRNIESNKDNQFFVQALAKTAHEVDIKVIAENVETQAELDILSNLFMDGVQGYFIGQPKESVD